MVFVADFVKALRCERSYVGSIPTDHPSVNKILTIRDDNPLVSSRRFRVWCAFRPAAPLTPLDVETNRSRTNSVANTPSRAFIQRCSTPGGSNASKRRQDEAPRPLRSIGPRVASGRATPGSPPILVLDGFGHPTDQRRHVESEAPDRSKRSSSLNCAADEIAFVLDQRVQAEHARRGD